MGYWLAFILVSALCATASIFAARGGRPIHFALTWASLAVLLVVIGYLDWSAQAIKDTSLATYIAGALLTPMVALAVVWSIKRWARPSMQWIVAAALAFVTSVGVVVAAYITGF